MYSINDIKYVDVGYPWKHKWVIDGCSVNLPIGVMFNNGEYSCGLSVQDCIDRINLTLD